MNSSDNKLETYVGKVKFRNPVILASGTAGFGYDISDVIDLWQIGGVATKTITLSPRQGNLPPRICETPAGMLNSIGLANPGLEYFCLLYTSPSPRDLSTSRMPSSA